MRSLMEQGPQSVAQIARARPAAQRMAHVANIINGAENDN
jgi:hypothetical protein